ncbi:MAG: hypothetical protein WManBPW_08430 [Shewanella algae]
MFWQLDSGRRWLATPVSAVPSRITMSEITSVVAVLGDVMARPALDSIIFAMDAEYLGIKAKIEEEDQSAND